MIDLDNIDFSKSQGIFIWGDVGHGKTLLMAKLFQDCMLQSVNYKYLAYDEADYLNSIGFNLSKRFEHLAFGNFEVDTCGRFIPDLVSYIFNPYRLGLQSNKYLTHLTPSYATHFYTEFQNYAPSEMNDYLRPDFVRVFQIRRHLKIGFVVDAQRPTDVAKKIRSMFTTFIECVNVEHLYDGGDCVGHKWTLRVINNSRMLDEYLRTNNKSLCEEITYTFDKCLFYNYNSLFCENLHYKGRENQDYYIKHFGNGDDDDLFSAPDGHFMTKKEKMHNSDNEDIEVVF